MPFCCLSELRKLEFLNVFISYVCDWSEFGDRFKLLKLLFKFDGDSVVVVVGELPTFASILVLFCNNIVETLCLP